MAFASLPSSFRHIREKARSQCNTLTLGKLMRITGPEPTKLIGLGRWLQRELPIRFARRIEDILRLPHVVVSNPSIHEVLNAYVDSFEAVCSCSEPTSENDEAQLFGIIKEQIKKHNPGTRLIAEGYRDVRRMYPDIRLDSFLHDHFTTRIATRILMDNYVEMRTPKAGFVGVVCQGMRPAVLVGDIVSDISQLTTSLYGFAPEVEYRGNLDCVLDYIPRHVTYMLREVLKNAFRATVERHLAKSRFSNGSEVPPVVVELQQGDVHVIVKVSDQGGGMPKKMQEQAWKYGWSTVRSEGATEAWQYTEESCSWERGATHQTTGLKSELAGYGFGLPLTRLHAQYFGGDVFMQALPGHGTDMYLILTHLKEGTPATEIDDLSTVLYNQENVSNSTAAP